MNTSKHLQSEKGQSLVLIALLMVALLGSLGVVLDGGGALITRRQSQGASDAAAFAGARTLAMRTDDSVSTEQAIWDRVVAFGAANGVKSPGDIKASFIDPGGTDICVINQNCGGVPASPLATGIRVSSTLQLKPYFISLLVGNQPIPIRTVAAVQSGPPVAASRLKPMTLKFPCDDLLETCFQTADEGGPEYQLFGDPQTGGNFQWTNYSDPCQTNTSDLEAYLMDTKVGGTVIADPDHLYMDPSSPAWMCGYTGVNTASQIRAALDYWLAKPESERHWIIPVYDIMNELSGSNVKYHVVMFADFVLTGYDFGAHRNPPTFVCSGSDPNAKCIKGKFYKKAIALQILPGRCNLSGLDICGIGLAQ